MDADLSPEQRQLFSNLKEMFPEVSSAAIKQNLHRGHQKLSEMILDGRLPAGDQFRDERVEENRARAAVAPRTKAKKREEKENKDAARAPKQRRRDAPDSDFYTSSSSDDDRKRVMKQPKARAGDAQPRNFRVNLREVRDAAAAAANSDEEEEDVPMRPLKSGDKCNGHGSRPLVAWVECGKAPKPHLLCLNCLMIRHADERLSPLSKDEYTCPIRGCASRISARALHGALRANARPFLAQLQEQQPRGMSSSSEEDEGEHDVTIQAASQPSTPAGSARRFPQLLQATTPLGRRLSQESLSGTPRTPHVKEGRSKWDGRVWTSEKKRAGEAGDDVPLPILDEELPVTEEEVEDLRMMAAFVDREKLKKLQSHFPETAVGWLVRHADYGMEALVEMVVKGDADPKMRERADGRGATTVIKQTLADRKQFECSVCFDDFDEHLAIKCVYLAKQRAEVDVEQTEEERVREEEEEEKSRRDEHKFCADCIIGHARAALEQQVIISGGVGIKCMQPRCTRALLRAHIEQVLDMQTRAVLDPLFSSEALLAADCDDVEKCQRCSYAAVIEMPKEQQRVFYCGNPACKHRHCRLCGREWDKVHKNRTCEELDPESVRKRVEEELTEQSMHKCPRCKKGIVKADGCNKITCPCGQLSCYVCKVAIRDYTHFKNGPAEEHLDKCPLWKDPTKDIEKARKKALKEKIAAAPDDKIREELRRLN